MTKAKNEDAEKTEQARKKHDYVMTRNVKHSGTFYPKDRPVALDEETKKLFLKNGYITG